MRDRCAIDARSMRHRRATAASKPLFSPGSPACGQFFRLEISPQLAASILSPPRFHSVIHSAGQRPKIAAKNRRFPPTIHAQSTKSPRPSLRPSTLYVATSHARPPKSSGAFSCPALLASIQEEPCDGLRRARHLHDTQALQRGSTPLPKLPPAPAHDAPRRYDPNASTKAAPRCTHDCHPSSKPARSQGSGHGALILESIRSRPVRLLRSFK